jgi:hypothetical protein
MKLFKKIGSWIKSLFAKKPAELPAAPQEMPSPSQQTDFMQAFAFLDRYALQLEGEVLKSPASEEYHSGDRPDNKRLALRLAAGEQVGSLQRILEPSDAVRDEWAALRKNYGKTFFQKLAYTADPDELAKLVKEADAAKLSRAQRAAAQMAKLGLISSDKQSIDCQIKEIMEWSKEALDDMEYRLIVKEKLSPPSTKTSGVKAKRSARKPQKKKAKTIRLSPKRKGKRK